MPTTKRCEQQRRNDGLDQPQEDECKNAQVVGDGREVVANFRAQQHGDKDPRRERTPQAAVDHQSSQREPAQRRKERGGGWAADLRAKQSGQSSNRRDEKSDVLAAMAVG